MDRFKFRVWDEERRQYENLCLVDVSSKDGQFRVLPLRKTGVIEQCTGLKDKNGKLVYEGDIVLWEGAKAFIRFVDGQWGLFCNQETSWQLDVRNIRFNRVLEKCEIIGNIHEVNHE